MDKRKLIKKIEALKAGVVNPQGWTWGTYARDCGVVESVVDELWEQHNGDFIAYLLSADSDEYLDEYGQAQVEAFNEVIELIERFPND